MKRGDLQPGTQDYYIDMVSAYVNLIPTVALLLIAVGWGAIEGYSVEGSILRAVAGAILGLIGFLGIYVLLYGGALIFSISYGVTYATLPVRKLLLIMTRDR